MTFFSFFWKIGKDYPFPISSIALLMALIGLAEGMVVAMVIPLLGLAFRDTSVLPKNGLLASALTGIQYLLSLVHLSPSIGVILAIIVGIFAFQGLIKFFQMHLQLTLLETYERTLVHNLFTSYANTSWKFFLAYKVGNLVNVLAVETGRATAAFQFALQWLAQSLIVLLYLVIALLVSWKITLTAIILGAIASLFLKQFVGQMEAYGAKTTALNSDFQALAFDFLSSMKMIKASATARNALVYIDQLNKEKTHLRYLSQKSGSYVPSFYFPLVMAMLAAIVYMGITYWQVSFAVLLIFVYLFYRLIPALSALQGAYQQALIFIPALHEVDTLMDNATTLKETSGKKQFAGLKKEIVFNNVHFCYDQGTPVLNGVSFHIQKGQSVALIGSSGAGKTSIVDLLLGLHNPQQGSILIDGFRLNEYSIDSWRKRIGYLSQDVFFFHDTLRTNVSWFNPSATEEEIWKALSVADAKEFVRAMPQGLDTPVGDRGMKLSGGQRQRLALARLLLHDPDIIIFDEATNALDKASEEKIQRALSSILKKKISIIISHRMSSIRHADRAYLLQKCRIVQQKIETAHTLLKKGLQKA